MTVNPRCNKGGMMSGGSGMKRLVLPLTSTHLLNLTLRDLLH